MEVSATAKYIRVQPRKVRIIADEVRGKNALHTVSLLRYHTSKSAFALNKVLVSAMANAQENHGLSADQLRIATIFVDEGPRLKRMRARAQGRGNRILKKTSHITVVVEDFEAEKAVKPHGSKAKARPTFASVGKPKGKVKAAPVAEPIVASPAIAETAHSEPEAVAEPIETVVPAHSEATEIAKSTSVETTSTEESASEGVN